HHDDLVNGLRIVLARNLHRVTDAALALKVDTLDDHAVLDVETGNDALHGVQMSLNSFWVDTRQKRALPNAETNMPALLPLPKERSGACRSRLFQAMFIAAVSAEASPGTLMMQA